MPDTIKKQITAVEVVKITAVNSDAKITFFIYAVFADTSIAAVAGVNVIAVALFNEAAVCSYQ